MEHSVVLQYPLIVNHIFKNLEDFDELRKCRLVCKVWNDEASKLLWDPLLLIFDHLSVEDLKNCRLVNKKWNKFAEVPLQKKIRFDFRHSNAIISFDEGIQNSMVTHICRTIKLRKDVHMADDQVQKFLSKIGPGVKEIELLRAKWNISILGKLLGEQLKNLRDLRIVSGVLPPNPDGDRMALFKESDDGNRLSKVSPYLKKLIFDMNILDGKRRIRDGFVEFLTDLLSSCPGLKYFWCESTSVYVRTYMHDFIVNSQDLLPNLGFLGTIIDYDKGRLQRLESRRFPLTKLYLRLGSVDINVLHSLIRSLKDTLKMLGLNFNGLTARASDAAKSFPSSKDLKKLEVLDLIGFSGKLSFISDFPNLRTLILKNVDIRDQFPFTAHQLACHKLKNLILVEVKDSNVYRNLVSGLTVYEHIKCSHYYSMDEFYYESNPEIVWEEHKRDIYHFPFS